MPTESRPTARRPARPPRPTRGEWTGDGSYFPTTAQAGIEAQGPSAGAAATANDSTAQIAAGAGLGSIAATAGTQDAKSTNDESARFGISHGPSAAARVHYGDADKDGHREYGVGADVGIFSFDVKSEDPLRTAAMMNPATMPLALAAKAYEGLSGNQLPNVTDAAVGAAKAAGGAIAGAGGAIADTASDLWNSPSNPFSGLFD